MEQPTITNGCIKNQQRYLNISYGYIAMLSGLILLHLFCITNVGLAQVLSLFEACIVIIYLIKRQLSNAILLFGVFILTSYDSKFFFGEPVGVSEIYNVSLLPFLSVYFYLFLSFIIFFISIFKIVKNKIKLNNPLVKFAVFTIIAMIPMGIFTYLSDGFSSLALTRDIKNNVVPALWTVSFFLLFYKDSDLLYKYERLIIHILFAYVVVAVITTSLNILIERGNRYTVLYLPLSSFFYTSIILFLNKIYRTKDKVFVAIMFSFTVYFQLLYDNCLAGKSWFVFLAVILVEVFYLFKTNFAKGILVVTLTTIIVGPKLVTYIGKSENTKLLEFVSLFEGAQSGDIDDVDSSAQFRILEFITISDYYLNHPQYLLFGRGVGGFVPNIGLFVYSETAFSDDQYKTDQFSVMHESLNMIYLKCGLTGLIFLLSVLLSGLKRINKDPLFFIGIIWLVFYWAYSVNLLFLGLPAFLIAYQKQHLIQKQVSS